LEQDTQYHAERIAKSKAWLMEQESRKKVRTEERIAKKKEIENPYLKEIETCESLIAYIHKLMVKSGLAKDEEVIVPAQLEKKFFNEQSKTDVEKKVKEHKLEREKTKKEREEEAMF